MVNSQHGEASGFQHESLLHLDFFRMGKFHHVLGPFFQSAMVRKCPDSSGHYLHVTQPKESQFGSTRVCQFPGGVVENHLPEIWYVSDISTTCFETWTLTIDPYFIISRCRMV